jgi:hypothetical protein
MPLAVGVLTAPPPVDPTTPAAPTLLADELGRSLTWIAPDDTVWPLTADHLPWYTLSEIAGLGVAQTQITLDPHPRYGSRIRHQHPEHRNIAIPIRFDADTNVELVEAMRELAGAFTQTRRRGADGLYPPGRLRVARPDGSVREILAHYQGGIDGEPDQGWLWDTAVISLLCEDPYFRALDAVTITREHSAGGTPFLNPFLTVSSGQVLGESTIINDGDVDAYPTWTITGPADAVSATNHTTGEEFEITHTLTAGQVITVTTDPPTVRGPSDTILTSALTWPGSVLWGLVPGVNEVEFSVTSSASGTSIVLSFVPRYEMA